MWEPFCVQLSVCVCDTEQVVSPVCILDSESHIWTKYIVATSLATAFLEEERLCAVAKLSE